MAATAPRRSRVFHSDVDILVQAIQATAPRRVTGQPTDPQPREGGGKRQPSVTADGGFSSPAPRVPPRREADATAARRMVAPPAQHPVAAAAVVQTPGENFIPDGDLPLTVTQEALPSADGYRPPSPPPLFSLRSVSMPLPSSSSEAAAAKALAAVYVPESGVAFEARPGMTEQDRIMLWSASAKAFFDFIDERRLNVATTTTAPTASTTTVQLSSK
jgi:hypothetical protein